MSHIDFPELPLPFDKLNNKTVTVLGSTGLIASTLVEALCDIDSSHHLNLKIIATCRDTAKAERRFSDLNHGDAVSFVRYDVRDHFPENTCTDFIIHSASPAHPQAFVEDPVGVMDANLRGIVNTLEFLRKREKTRLMYVSSGEIYGEKTHDGPYVETDKGLLDPLNFRSCYPESKRAAETYCRCYMQQYGVDAVIVRPGHVYGPALMSESTRVDVQFMRNALSGSDIIMKSLGEQKRSYIHVDDVISGMLFALLKGNSGEAYNISNRDSNITIRRYAEILSDASGVGICMDVDPNACKGSSKIMDSTLDSSKLESLGWSARIPAEVGLPMTYNALKNRRSAL